MPAPSAHVQRLQRAIDAGAVRLAFVGQATYFDLCALEAPAGILEPRFFDFRYGEPFDEAAAGLAAFDPHVIVMFRPELAPATALADVDAVTVGFLTEPLPRERGDAHPDLERRLEYLQMIDPANWDRIISFDPLVAETVDELVPVWRSMPLPVSDRCYAEPTRRTEGRPQVLFPGRSTDHREDFLVDAKHHYDILHIAHGLTGDRLIEALTQSDVGINVHNEPYPSFENRVSTFCAAGLLVISEELSPTHGLEPGLDFIQVEDKHDLLMVLFSVHRELGAFDRMRARARQKAERFRASSVYERLVGDLARDLPVFGTPRRA
ncbi:MAG TPA: hypothetical protein VFT50_04575 [Baekduia sp.]|nr:hypothetical protein [Baekduia sp.]